MTDENLLGEAFRVVGHLGSGGYGEVYSAERSDTGERIAVKVFERDLIDNKDEHARLLREVNNARTLDHPNVVKVFEFGVLPTGRPYYAMELCRGYSIAHLLAEPELPDVARIVHLMLEVLDGLGAAHDRGIIHRDMKLVNVQVVATADSAEQAKILDFGLAKRSGGGQSQELTKDGQVFGTAAYIAPEALMGDPVDGRADLYACGIMLFELIARRRPYLGRTPQAIVEGHIRSPVPSLRKTAGRRRVNQKLDAVVAKALAKRPDDRFESAAALSKALVAAVPRAADTTFPFVADHLRRGASPLRDLFSDALESPRDSSRSGLGVPSVYSDTSVVRQRLAFTDFEASTSSLAMAPLSEEVNVPGSALPPPGQSALAPPAHAAETPAELRVARAARGTLAPPRTGELPTNQPLSDPRRPVGSSGRFEAIEVLADTPASRLARGVDRDYMRPVLIRTIKETGLRPEELARTLRGCANHAQVLNDHVLRIFGRGRDADGSSVVIYEWMPG
ncbi:MAG: serine/threonine-protein kinase, partial [Planctomycetota bacterium]